MRLGQLARQLDIKPEKVVAYLAQEKEITIKSHPNSKVEDDLVDMITNHFKPVVEEEKVEATKEKEAPKKEAVAEIIKESKEEVKTPEHIETVKPEKPEGLKIVGKIDLPNKKEINVEVDGVVYDQETLDNKKKEELKADRERKAIEKEAKRKEDEERKAKAREQRQVEQERQAMLETEKHNLLSKEEEKKKAVILQAQKEREEKLDKKRKKQQADHYAQRHAANTSSTSKKKKKVIAAKTESVEETTVIESDNVSTDSSIEENVKLSGFQKFIKWLNT